MYILTMFLEKIREIVNYRKKEQVHGVFTERISFYCPSFHTILMFNQVLVLMTVKSIKEEWFVIAGNYPLNNP